MLIVLLNLFTKALGEQVLIIKYASYSFVLKQLL